MHCIDNYDRAMHTDNLGDIEDSLPDQYNKYCNKTSPVSFLVS